MLTEQKGIQVDKFYPPTDWQYSFPEGYTRLEYLESTGTQYIDTGIAASSDLITDIDFYVTESSYLFGRLGTIDGINKSYSYTGSSANAYVRIGSTYVYQNSEWGLNKWLHVHIENDYDKTTLNGTKFTNQSSYGTANFSNGNTLCLFRDIGSGGGYFKGRVKNCRIKQGNTLLINLIPAKRNSDNKPGMYDLVNNVFYTNAGEGEFVMGPELYLNNSQIDIRQKNNLNYGENYKIENDELVWANPNLYLLYPNGEKHFTTNELAPVKKGFTYGNTTASANGYINLQTQEFIPAPEGALWKHQRDLKVIPPEDNTITLLYGVASDFSKYALFGLLASVSSGTYDVYIDDILYATTASGTQTDIDFSTLGTEYVSIGTCTTPEELVLHKIVIKPTNSGETITKFRCARTTDVTTTQQQGVLWIHFELENRINVTNLFCAESQRRTYNLYAITAKNNKILVSATSNTSSSGIYSLAGSCSSLIYLPVLEFSNKNYSGGAYLVFNSVPAKRIIIKNNGSFNINVLRQSLAEKVEIENPIKYHSGTGNSVATGATNLKIYPKIITNDTTTTLLASNYNSLYPTKIDDSLSINREILRLNGTSTASVRGIQGLKVSNEAPFSSTSSPQINVSYTGLDRDSLVELFESMPGFMQLTKIGSPTITDGVVSGFSSSDYLSVNTPFVLSPSVNSDIVLKVNFSSFEDGKVVFGTYGNYGLSLNIRHEKKLRLYLGSNGTTWNVLSYLETNYTFVENTDYWIKISFKQKVYSISVSTDGENYINAGSINITISTEISYNLTLGIGRVDTAYFTGSIDLNNSYIKINSARYQFQLPDDTTTRAINITAASGNNLTKVGNVIIDTNGVASGFSDSDYLNIVGNINLSSNFKIQIKITPSSVTTGSKKFLSIFYTNSIYLDFYTSGTTPRIDCQYSGSSYWTSIASNLSYDIPIVITISGNGKNLNVETNQNNISQSSSKTLQELGIANIVANNIYLGRGHSTSLPMANGSIDLENTYIKADQNYLMKGYLLDSDRAIATNKGWTITG